MAGWLFSKVPRTVTQTTSKYSLLRWTAIHAVFRDAGTVVSRLAGHSMDGFILSGICPRCQYHARTTGMQDFASRFVIAVSILLITRRSYLGEGWTRVKVESRLMASIHIAGARAAPKAGRCGELEYSARFPIGAAH